MRLRSPDDIYELRKLLSLGRTMPEISRELRLPVHCIVEAVRELGLKRGRNWEDTRRKPYA